MLNTQTSASENHFESYNKEASIHEVFTTYPNPTTGNLTVLCDEDKFQSWKIIDVLGKVIWTNDVRINNFQIDLSPLEDGIYYLELIGKDQQVNKTILKN